MPVRTAPPARPCFPPSAPALLAGAVLAAAGGCAGLPAMGDPPPADRFAAAEDGDGGPNGDIQRAGAESPADESPFYTDPEPRAPGRLQKTRAWLNSLTGARGEASVSYAEVPPEARRAFETAKANYERGGHQVAAKAFKSLARRYADTSLEEDSLFYHAESLYAGGRLAPAQDAYDTLLDRYPSTRHLDAVSERQFETARRWLGFPEVVRKSDVRPVSYETADLTPAPKPATEEPERPFDPTLAVPILPNFHDPSRPLFDTQGRALQALKHVWLNDPTGDLADDALMLSASHHLRRGDNMEADRLYEILRKEYPDSPYVEDAYVLGSHARAVVWQGADYDDAALEESRVLKESTLRLFPNSAERSKIREELAKMSEAAAARDWALVELYQRKGKPAAVAIYCQKVLEDHPDSRYAARARAVWDALPASAKANLPPLPGAVVAPRETFEAEPSGTDARDGGEF